MFSCTRPLTVFECVQALKVRHSLFLLSVFISPFLHRVSQSHPLSPFPLHLYLRPVILSLSFHLHLLPFTSPPRERQHFIIQQGFTGTLWNHLFHGSLIECDTSHTSNGRSSVSSSQSLSVWVSLWPPPPFGTFVSVSCFGFFNPHKQRHRQYTHTTHKKQMLMLIEVLIW